MVSLGAHSNPISSLWDAHRYPWAHTATRSLFFGIHTDIPGRTQQPDLFSLVFTQISLDAHSNPISFLWDSHRYPWAHTATRSLFFGIHTDIPGRTQQPDLFSLGFTQISLGAHSNPVSFLWDSHRYPWAHTATRSLFSGIHTDIPGRTQQPELFSLGFTQISLGAHSNPSSVFSLGFTQISLGSLRNPSIKSHINPKVTSKQSINPRSRINKMNFKPRRTSCSNPSVALRTNSRILHRNDWSRKLNGRSGQPLKPFQKYEKLRLQMLQPLEVRLTARP